MATFGSARMAFGRLSTNSLIRRAASTPQASAGKENVRCANPGQYDMRDIKWFSQPDIFSPTVKAANLCLGKRVLQANDCQGIESLDAVVSAVLHQYDVPSSCEVLKDVEGDCLDHIRIQMVEKATDRVVIQSSSNACFVLVKLKKAWVKLLPDSPECQSDASGIVRISASELADELRANVVVAWLPLVKEMQASSVCQDSSMAASNGLLPLLSSPRVTIPPFSSQQSAAQSAGFPTVSSTPASSLRPRYPLTGGPPRFDGSITSFPPTPAHIAPQAHIANPPVPTPPVFPFVPVGGPSAAESGGVDPVPSSAQSGGGDPVPSSTPASARPADHDSAHDASVGSAELNAQPPLLRSLPVQHEPQLGDAVRRDTSQPEADRITNRLPDFAGKPLPQLPTHDPDFPMDQQQEPSSRGCLAGKLEYIHAVEGNSQPLPFVPRHKHHHNDNWRDDFQRGAMDSPFDRYKEEMAAAASKKSLAHEAMPGEQDASDEGASGQGDEAAGELSGGSASTFSSNQENPNLRQSSWWKDYAKTMTTLFTIMVCFSLGSIRNKGKFMDAVDGLKEQCLMPPGDVAPTEAVEAVQAMCFDSGLMDAKLQNVSCLVSCDTPGRAKYWRQYVSHLASKVVATPLLFSRVLQGTYGMTMQLFDVFRKTARIRNPEDGTYNCLVPFNRMRLTQQKDKDVAEAKAMGYEFIRSGGIYSYVVKNLQSFLGMLVMGLARTDPQVLKQVVTDPARLSQEAKAAAADCEINATLVQSFDGSVWTRGNEQITWCYMGLTWANCPRHVMYPIGCFLGSDKQKQVNQAFKRSPDPGSGVPSLFDQATALVKGFTIDLLPDFFSRKRLFIKADIAVVVDQPAQAAVCGVEDEGCAPNKDWFSSWTDETRSMMQKLFAVMDISTGDVYDELCGVMHTCYIPGCDCRRCAFKTKSDSAEYGGHEIPEGPLTVKELYEAFSMSKKTFCELNGLDPNTEDQALIKDLPEGFKCKAVIQERLEGAQYTAGSMLAKMKEMMEAVDGRYLIVLRRPSFGLKGGYPKAMLFGNDIITKLYPAVMHLSKCVIKRWVKLTVHHAIDRDGGKLDGEHLQKVRQLCADAGCPIELRTSKKKNASYPKIVMPQDFGPLSRLVKKCGMELVDAAGFGEDSMAADDGYDVVVGAFKWASSDNASKADAWKKHLELLLQLIDMIKVKGCRCNDDKEVALALGTDILYYYLKAGMSHKQLSNYYLLLLFIGEWQPPRNANHLIMGQFLNCPAHWDVWQRVATCLKDVSDEVTELCHFISKLIHTCRGGCKWVQSELTTAADTVKRDLLGMLQILERYQVRLLELVQQRCPLAPSKPRVTFNTIIIPDPDHEPADGEEQRMITAEGLLQRYHDEHGLQYRTKDEGGYDHQELEMLETLVQVLGEVDITRGQVIKWLSRKRYPAQPTVQGGRVLPAKLVEDADVLAEETAATRRQPRVVGTSSQARATRAGTAHAQASGHAGTTQAQPGGHTVAAQVPAWGHTAAAQAQAADLASRGVRRGRSEMGDGGLGEEGQEGVCFPPRTRMRMPGWPEYAMPDAVDLVGQQVRDSDHESDQEVDMDDQGYGFGV